MSGSVAPADGVALIERTLAELSQEEDRRSAAPVQWDTSLAELSSAVRTRIPAVVEERCRNARHRTNCGVIGAVRHAWASADDLLHLWDYHREDPQVLVIPADSAIVSVGVCPPRPGVFDAGSAVDFLLVLCTRLTVSLVGLRASGPADPFARPLAGFGAGAAPAATAGAFGGLGGLGGGGAAAGGGLFGQTPLFGASAALPGSAFGGPQAPSTSTALALATPSTAAAAGSLQLVQLEGYVARTEGAIFHTMTHTADGHVFLSCGAPHIFELAYSRTPGWFHSRCRLIRHATGLWSRVKDFLTLSQLASNRVRLIACAPREYAVSVDDSNTLRLFGIRDSAVGRSESVAVLEELAAATIGEVAAQYLNATKQHLASRKITHIFPTIGLDGNLRLRAVTAAGDRLLFLCSSKAPAASAPAPAAGAGAEAAGGGQEARLSHGFWLRQASEGAPGGAAALAAWPQGAGAFALAGQQYGLTAAAGRVACLQEHTEPCVYASGVWLASSPRTGGTGSDVGVTARVDSCPSAVGSGGSRNLFTSVSLDSPVFDLTEEQTAPWTVAAASRRATGGGALQTAPLGFAGTSADGEASAFRSTRSFAVMLRGSVQVFRLTFKTQSLARPPTTPAECCAHFAQMALPPADTPSPSAPPVVEGGKLWSWAFDDAGVPSFEEQRRALESRLGPPSLHLGRWFCGMLRFLAIVLRPVWSLPLVEVSKRRGVGAELAGGQGGGLALALTEDTVRQLLARLRPALRFARQQGLAALHRSARPAGGGAAVPASAAARALAHSQERRTVDEGLGQVQRLLGHVLDVAERAQQVLGLLGVLHAQRSGYRILQSAVVAPSLGALTSQPLGAIVTSAEALAPVVQLCAATVVESGLTTPAPEVAFGGRVGGRTSGSSGAGRRQSRAPPAAAAGGAASVSGEVCRELEEQCPGIFAQVDLAYVQSRLGAAADAARGGSAAGPAAAGELLRRYATCVSPSSMGEHWLELARSVQKMAAEEPARAADVCAEKLEQLQQLRFAAAPSEEDKALASERARLLLDALLGALGADPKVRCPGDNTSARGLIEHLLKKTAALRFVGRDDAAVGTAGTAGPARQQAGKRREVSFVHGAILDHLLSSPHQHFVLEGLLASTAVDMESYLRSRCDASPAAGELLWKHLLRQGRYLEASDALQRLADRPDKDCGLAQRVHTLDLARQAAGRAAPHGKDVAERLAAKLDVAIRVQVPLHDELQLIAADDRVTERWRKAAAKRLDELQRLLSLQELYQTAADFSLYHIVLVWADTSSLVKEREVRTGAWISTFFPPASSPYSPAELGSQLPAWQQGLFPLLMVRRCDSFLSRSGSATPSPVSAVVRQDDLQQRAMRLFSELGVALRESSALWEVRCIATLMEYCNCLWLRTVGASAPLGDGMESQAASAGTAGEPEDSRPRAADLQRTARAWVALQLLPQRPFHFSRSDVLKFYAVMLDQLPSWLQDLQSVLPADPSRRRPQLSEDDAYVHTADVVLTVLDQWIAQVESSRGDDRALEEFGSSWTSVAGVLSNMRTRLADVDGEVLKASAQWLLKDLRRLETAGRRLAARCSPPPGTAPALPPLPPLAPGAATFELA